MTARPLPNGRGFLRLVDGSGEPSPGAVPPTSGPPPVAPATVPALRFDANGQADLFSWAPPKREPVQLSLFPSD